ncbi:MAG: hypothetical protein IT370_13270 [Deltaproteobacteria bacterium]|nr:hypothetical protein [Deltaproteobacteria bacterium]
MRKLLVVTLALGGCLGDLTPMDAPPVGGADAAAPPGGGAPVFRPTIEADLEARGCTAAACHGGSAPMRVKAQPASDDAWRMNWTEVKARAGTASASVLLQKAAGAGGHPALVPTADPVAARWRAWIEAGAPLTAPSSADAGVADAAVARDGGPGGDGQLRDAAPAPTWSRDVGPLITRVGCRRCHGSSGSYSLESYQASLGNGRDAIANVIAGDPLSLLVQYCEQGHQGMTYGDALVVLRWVVDGQAREN